MRLPLFLRAYAVTIAVEIPVLVCAARMTGIGPSSVRAVGRVALAGWICSTVTIPFVWFVFPRFIRSPVAFYLTAEGFVIAAEACIIAWILRAGPVKSLLLSLTCNVASFIAGFAAGIS